MKVKLYNTSLKEVGELDLSEKIFSLPFKRDLLYQIARIERHNRRQPLAHAKDRSEVRGGGKKPWQQKGTGRARHGSIRSPLWKGGGVTHGPRKERVFARKANQKMKQEALRSILSEKARRGDIKVIKGISVTNAKTKELAPLFDSLVKEGKRTVRAIFLLGEHDAKLERALRNLPYLSTKTSQEVSVLDILNHRLVVMTPESLSKLETRLHK